MRDFEVVVDGDSVPMISASDGRIFRVQELINGQWQHPNEVHGLVTVMVEAMNYLIKGYAS